MFFDNASTTIIDEKYISTIKDINDNFFYNPGALYSKGRDSKKILDKARTDILDSLNASGKIIFTGSATEANNLALFGLLKKNTKKILVSMSEHPSIYNTALEIKNRGYNVEFIKLNKDGTVDFEDFKRLMTDDVDLVSIMHVCNETGAKNDIATFVSYARDINPNVIFHSDGVQAVGKICVDLDELDVDMYTMSAHKIHGLKGVGALFVKDNIKLKPIIFGGGQESGLRSGTENLIGIKSLSEAIIVSTINQEANFKLISELKDKFLNLLSQSGIKYSLHSFDNCSPYIVSLSFAGCRSETILNMLSDKGVFVGNGSACSSKKSGNRILESMGVSSSDIEGNIRISFSKYNTFDEIEVLVDKIEEVVNTYLKKVR